MVRMISIFSLKPGIDPDEAYKLWREKHTQWAKELFLPELRKYTIHRVIETFGDVEALGKGQPFGMAQFYFDDLESARRVINRRLALPPDKFDDFTIEYASVIMRMLVQEEEIEVAITPKK